MSPSLIAVKVGVSSVMWPSLTTNKLFGGNVLLALTLVSLVIDNSCNEWIGFHRSVLPILAWHFWMYFCAVDNDSLLIRILVGNNVSNTREKQQQ